MPDGPISSADAAAAMPPSSKYPPRARPFPNRRRVSLPVRVGPPARRRGINLPFDIPLARGATGNHAGFGSHCRAAIDSNVRSTEPKLPARNGMDRSAP